MKKFLILIFISLIINFAFGQYSFGKSHQDSADFEVKINLDSFLLGTLSDYMGRFYAIDRATQIDRYYPPEETVAHYIADLIINNYNVRADLQFLDSRHATIFSSELAQQLHSQYFDEESNFIAAKLDTEEKMYSFLLGAYYRYGKKMGNNIYKIHLYNSPKDEQLYRILKALHCDKIVYKFLRDYVPSSTIFYFEATPRMKKYFKTIEQEKEKLDIANKKEVNKYFDGGKEGRELKSRLEAEEKQFLESLELIFK